jgi:hypothetical protein
MSTKSSSQATTRECPYCREQVNSRAVKCRYCGSALTPDIPESIVARAEDGWKIVYVGEERWRVEGQDGPSAPPPEVQEIARQYESAAFVGGPRWRPWCTYVEKCEWDKIEIGPISVPIAKCRWVVICGMVPDE